MSARMILSSFALASLAACSSTGKSSQSDVAAQQSLENAWLACARANDWSRIADVYDADCAVLPPNMASIDGRANVQKFFKEFPHLVAIDTKPIDTEVHGDTAWVRGSYTLKLQMPGGGSADDHGKYIEIHKRQSDGTWRIHRDMWSSDVPESQ